MFTLPERGKTASRLGDLETARFYFSIPEIFPGQGGLFEHVASLERVLLMLDYMGKRVREQYNQHMQCSATTRIKPKHERNENRNELNKITTHFKVKF
jgi:hypothetical protein